MMRQRWVRRCVSIGTTVAAVGATWSIAVWAATPVEVLTATAEAARTQNFQGVAIYSDGYGSDDYLKAVRIIHRYKNNVESERVTALNGAPCEIFRVDGRVFCVLPKDQTLQLSGAPLKGFLRQLTPERLHQVAAWYDFKNLGEQRIAARSCVGAAVMPRDAFRYGYEVWADEQTHIPLKFSLVNQAGKVLEQVMFTEIDYPADIPDDVFTTQVNTAKFRVVSQPEPPPLPFQPLASGDPNLEFTALPPGFRPVMHDRGRVRRGAPEVQHTLLTDGLSAISVFSHPATGAPHYRFRGGWHMGSAEAYGRKVGSLRVTVVGEAPVATVKMIGDGVRAAPQAAAAAALPATP